MNTRKNSEKFLKEIEINLDSNIFATWNLENGTFILKKAVRRFKTEKTAKKDILPNQTKSFETHSRGYFKSKNA